MSENGGEVEVETPISGYPVLPKDVVSEIGSIKLFNKWDFDVEIRDISLTYGAHGRLQRRSKITNNEASATTSKSDLPSTFLTPPVDMHRSVSERLNAPSSND